VFDGQIFVQSLYNIPESEIDGFEVSFDWAATDSLTISGGLGILDSEITRFDTGVRDSLEAALNAVITNSVALPPATQAAFDANFEGYKLPKFPHKSATLGIQHEVGFAAFGGSRLISRLDYSVYQERYWWLDNTDEEGTEYLLDASFALELKNDWELAVWCKNCTDRDYISAYEPAEMVLFSGPAKDVKYAARGRTWGAQLTYQF
jgi:outer membrane receptor protein involved in Fe transport